MEDNNHILSPLKPLYSNISTFISSLVGSFHSFNRNADHITFRWLLSRNALLERSLYYSPLMATPSCIKTASNFLSCLFFFFWSNFFMPFTSLEMIIFLFGKCEITHLRWFFKNTHREKCIFSLWKFSFKIISELPSLLCHSITCAGKWSYLFSASLK